MMRSGAGSTLDPKLRPGAVAIPSKGDNKHKLRRGKMSGTRNAVLPSSVQLESVDGGKTVQQQLREILNKNAVRVIDLFRQWDGDGDGKVSPKEFRIAIAALGYKAPRSDVDEVFAQLDADKSGEIDYNELNRALRRGGETTLDPSLMPGGAGELQLKAKNKSPSPTRGEGSPKGFTAALAANISPPPSKLGTSPEPAS